MPLASLLVLAIVQGLAELLPVSSSAHVIVAAKLLGLDPTTPEMTLLLVALHSGTMVAVIAYFWRAWRRTFFGSTAAALRMAGMLALATLCTAAVGYPVKWAIEKVALRAIPDADIELIFGNLWLVSAALAAAGALIVYAGLRRAPAAREVGWREAGWMGAVQGLCLPFRGFSRSGATISTGLILGGARARVEEFSFALAVILTPPVVMREVGRLLRARAAHGQAAAGGWLPFAPAVAGAALSFLAGLVALRWLSRWLERGAWHLFGVYCLAAAAVVLALRLGGM
jgi:undecaprenyl-diphosphatase